MKTVIALTLLAVAGYAGASPKWDKLSGYDFEQYKADHAKAYECPKEHATRKQLFDTQLKEVRSFNAQVPAQSWRKGMNHMSDWTMAEKTRLQGTTPKSIAKKPVNIKASGHVMSGKVPPASLDWRTVQPSVLTAVKDQGQCGSCWAHAATEALETQWAIKHKDLFVLSQQQLVACMPNPRQCGGTGGCMGGTIELAYDFLSKRGQTEEWMYSYGSYFGTVAACSLEPKMKSFAQPTGYVAITPNDQAAFVDALVSVGPIAISADASHWNDYESGIYSGCNYANNITIDHGIVVVGYGHDETLNADYWIVRNSWSANFGEEGYIRLVKEAVPKCGTSVEWDTMGDGCKGDPDQVHVCGQCGMLYDALYPLV